MTTDPETFLLLGAWRDGELSPGEALAMERRLAADPSLRGSSQRLATLSAEIGSALSTSPIPDALRARIARQIGIASRPRAQPWQALAATLLIGLLAGGAAEHWRAAPSTEDAVVAGHLRALIAPQPYDIASSNRHVVKPWFNGRTTIAPDAIDLADQGSPLAGGRIDVIDGRPVPTLVYRHDQHIISVTIVSTSDASAGQAQLHGYRVRHWRTGDLTYWLVSDLDATALDTFERLFRQAENAAR